ncbi:hypothetical protein Cs7R123_33850 [Catellatospora sp. TT07R-123]|nr:hypothetical protein Cs7R123_33850 [Catellatospora sp. TT07R-123]
MTPAGNQDRAKIFGIIGIVTALCCTGLLGILFGWLSLREAKQNGGSTTLGWIAIVVGVLALCSKDLYLWRYSMSGWKTGM